MKRLRILGLSTGAATPFDGKFVQRYDPSYCMPGIDYDGGLLEVTSDPEKALTFPDAAEALECWRKSYGIRPDGKPNRPLTAFTVVVE